MSLPWLFEFWALPHQLPPEGAWKSWVIMGGRGAGKTRAGAEWVRAQVEGARPLDPGAARRVALVTFPMLPDARVGAKSDAREAAGLMREIVAAFDAASAALTGG